MPVTDPLVLPADVLVVPVEQLPPELREQFEYRAGDFAVTRPLSRTPSTIVDGKTAALLQAFRSPTTLVDAIITFSSGEQLDPRQTLESAFPVLSGFVNTGLLVKAGSELAEPISSSLASGAPLGPFEIVSPIHLIVDTEVYLARAADATLVALKVARATAGSGVERMFEGEAEVLELLDGRVNPRLIALGEAEGRPYLAMSWCPGVDAYAAAADARKLMAQGDPAPLLELGQRVIAAYAHLHAQNVLHGDVHPRNVVVDADGRVTLIDFGLGSRIGGAGGGRGGVDFFMEPELANARLSGTSVAASPAGEQYSVAALVYLLMTGSHTHAFSLETGEMLRQLVEEPALPFAQPELPAVERTLQRALAKAPGDRFASVQELSLAFGAAVDRDCRSASASASALARVPVRGLVDGGRLLADVLARLEVGGPLLANGIAAPTASVMNGAAGFAYALRRISMLREDEGLLAGADAWSTKALLSALPDAFWNPELDITPEAFGQTSLYHTAPGMHCVNALLAHARGDDDALHSALDAFARHAGGPSTHIDVAFGKAGLLLGCALLGEALGPAGGEAVRLLAIDLADSIWAELQGEPPIAQSTRITLLGAAHGWAGILYALLRGIEAFEREPPEGLAERLEQLAALARPARRGVFWPRDLSAPPTQDGLTASWCNGAAGFVHLWTSAHRVLGADSYSRLAELAAWTAYEGPEAGGDLCCGLGGRAYALLNLHKQTGEGHWLLRARDLAERAASAVRAAALRRDSLYKGEVGVALLLAELERPADAAMPLFEGEGW